MKEIEMTNKRIVSSTPKQDIYLININGSDVRAYQNKIDKRFGFNMIDLAKAFKYETVEELQKSDEWAQFSTQISNNLEDNTGTRSEFQMGKVSDIIDVASANSTPVARSAMQSGQVWKGWAGMNGALTDSKDVFFWGGGDIDEAVEGKCPITFFADGSGWVANQNISWDELGNLLVRGVFESNKDGNRIIIDPTTRSIKMITASNKTVGTISFVENNGDTYASMSLTGTIQGKQYNTLVSSNSIIMNSHDGSGSITNQFKMSVRQDGRLSMVFDENSLPDHRDGVSQTDGSLGANMWGLYRDGEFVKIKTS